MQLDEHLGLLQRLGEGGDFLEQLGPRQVVLHVVEQHRAEEVVAVGGEALAVQGVVLLLDGCAALFGRGGVAVLVEQRALAARVGGVAVVGRGAREEGRLGRAAQADVTRLDEERCEEGGLR